MMRPVKIWEVFLRLISRGRMGARSENWRVQITLTKIRTKSYKGFIS